MSLTWLPNSLLKNIELPEVHFEPYNNQNYSGYCSYYYKKIVIVEPPYWWEPKCTESTIAHEFAHWLQYLRKDVQPNPPRPDPSIDYDTMITSYFRNSKWEYEALLFQTSIVAKQEGHDRWLRKLVNPKGVDWKNIKSAYCKNTMS